MNLKLCYITGWSLLVATGLSAQNRGDLAVKVARDSGQVIELTLQGGCRHGPYKFTLGSICPSHFPFGLLELSFFSGELSAFIDVFSSNPDLTRTISKVTLGGWFGEIRQSEYVDGRR